jgi:DNA-binding ferritin-like protein (Dps family)
MFNYKQIIGDKKAWNQMEARARLLPEEYEFVYHKIQHYMWHYAAGSGMDMMVVFEDLLNLFEEGAANGKKVLEITGQDVAAFCDELLRNTRTSTEDWREALNHDIRKKLRTGRDS